MHVMILLALKTHKWGGIEEYLCSLAQQLAARRGRLTLVVYEASGQVCERWRAAGAHVEQERTLGQHTGRLKALFAKGRPDVVILQFFSLRSAVALKCKLAGAKSVIVVDDHSSPRTRAAKPLRALLYGASLTPASRVVAVSGFVSRRHAEDYKLSRHKRRQINNGVRPLQADATAPMWPRRESTQEQVILVAGYMIEEKGFSWLLSALGGMEVERRRRLTLWLAGSGPQLQALQAQASAHNINALFLGSRDDVSALMRAADLVIVPSLWDEAFGLVTAEAMMAAKAIIATEVGASPELLARGQAGVLVSPGDTAALTREIEALLDDPARRAALGEEAQRRAMQYYHVDRMIEEVIELCEEVYHG